MKRFPFAVFVTILCVLQWTKGKHMSDIVKEKIADLNRAVSVEQEEADKAALQFCTSSTAPVTNFNPAKIMPLEFCESTSKCYNETNGQLEEFVQLKQEIKGLKELADKKVILIAKSRFILMNESHNLLSIKQKLSDIETKKVRSPRFTQISERGAVTHSLYFV